MSAKSPAPLPYPAISSLPNRSELTTHAWRYTKPLSTDAIIHCSNELGNAVGGFLVHERAFPHLSLLDEDLLDETFNSSTASTTARSRTTQDMNAVREQVSRLETLTSYAIDNFKSETNRKIDNLTSQVSRLTFLIEKLRSRSDEFSITPDDDIQENTATDLTLKILNNTFIDGSIDDRKIPEDELKELVINSLNHAEPEIRLAAAKAIPALMGKHSISFLIEAAAKEKNRFVASILKEAIRTSQ